MAEHSSMTHAGNAFHSGAPGERRAARWVRFVQRFSTAILSTAAIITVTCVWLASRIRLDTNIIALLPEETAEVQDLEQVLAKTEGTGDLMVLIESPDLARSVAYARRLLPELERLPWVKRAAIGQDTSFQEAHRLLYMETEDLEKILAQVRARIRYEKLRHNPFYVALDAAPPPELRFEDIEAKYEERRGVARRYYQTEDGTMLILIIRPTGITSDIPFARRIYRETQALISKHDPSRYHPEMRVSVGGTFKNRLDEYTTIVGDVRDSALWVGIAVIALIVAFFRHPAALPLVVLPLFVSLSATFAFASLTIGSLNLITVFLFIILFGLGIDFGIHMLSRYRRERTSGAGLEAALIATVAETGRASLVAALTTAAAFFVLVFATFRGFSEFGLIAGVGLVFSSAAYLSVFPALVVAAERAVRLFPARPGSGDAGSEGIFLCRLLAWPRLVMVVSALITIVAVGSLRHLAFEYDFRELRSDVRATRMFNQKMRQVFTHPRDPSVVLVDGPEEAAAVAAELRRRIEEKGSAGTMQTVRTLADLIPADQERKLEVIEELRALIDGHRELIPEQHVEQIDALARGLDVQPVSVETLPEFLKQPFLGPEESEGQLVFIFQKRSLLDIRNAALFSEEVRDIEVGGETYQAAGEALVYAAMYQSLKREAPFALAAVILVLFLTVLADVRSASRALLMLMPLSVGALWMLGAMALMGVRFNLLNAVALPCVLGLGVDGGVHLYHARVRASAETVRQRLSHTGVAVSVCIATSMIGFGGMIIADHPGLRSIAIAALLGLGANLVASVLFFPALLLLRSPRPARAPFVGETATKPKGSCHEE